MKKIIILFCFLGVLIAGYYYVSPYIIQEKTPEKTVTSNDIQTPTFTEIPLDFVHQYKKDTYAFAGSALIDIDGDGVDEIFIGGGEGQLDGLFRFEDGNFKDIASQYGLENTKASGGALSIDIDNDNDVDLFVTKLDGIYLYTNEGNAFTEEKLNISFEENTVPMSLAATDINKDGLADLYVSTFISPEVFKSGTFNKDSNRSRNIMLLNKGTNSFEDITKKTGLEYRQNTFQATFVDLNNDTWQDLVLAPNTDKVVVYENKKDGTFEIKDTLTEFGFWMGLAVADIDNDGDQDLFFSNIGNTIPVSSARGDLLPEQVLDAQWALVRNDGNFRFVSVTQERKLNDYEFGWGALFGDLNLDGLEDLLVSENYIKWPAHKLSKLDGRVFLQESNGSFSPVTKTAGLANPYYGTSPLLTDLNKDGYLDVLFINLDGESKAHINNGGDGTYLKVFLSDKASSLGARVDVEKTDGTVLSKQVMAGVGLLSDTGTELIFGLDGDSKVKQVSITFSNGSVQIFKDIQTGNRIVVE